MFDPEMFREEVLVGLAIFASAVLLSATLWYIAERFFLGEIREETPLARKEDLFARPWDKKWRGGK